MVTLYLALLALSLATTLFDLRFRRIPNWVTLPLLCAAVATHFPANPDVWLMSAMILGAWKLRGIGGGDAKIWLAAIWLTPGHTLVAFFTLAATSLLQFLVRLLRKKALFGIKAPAAWRLVPYSIWLLLTSL